MQKNSQISKWNPNAYYQLTYFLFLCTKSIYQIFTADLDDWYQVFFLPLLLHKNTLQLNTQKWHVTGFPKTFLFWTSQAKLLLLAPSTSQHGWQTNWSKHWKIISLQNFSGWVFTLEFFIQEQNERLPPWFFLHYVSQFYVLQEHTILQTAAIHCKQNV